VVKEVVFAVPGDLSTPTGGYAYDRRIMAELPELGWQPNVVALGDGFPRPTGDVHADACARLAAQASGCPIVIDGLAFGVLPEAAAALKASHRLVALVHHPLALETGLSAAEAADLRGRERAVLADARHVIATSRATARLLATDYAVSADRMSVVAPGTDRVAARPRTLDASAADGVVALLAVGAVVPRKGYDVLVAALAGLAELTVPWRLVIAGDCGRSPETFQRLAADISGFDLARRIDIRGAVSAAQLASLYAGSDLFVLPSRFEGYGMAYAEAVAHGLPVVGTTAGAIPETVPLGAGVLVPPDDVAALTATLRRLIESPEERARLAAGARAAAFPSWREQARLFAEVLDGLA
jgi:glycosyltransferase involved in cell wall biosynthesis